MIDRLKTNINPPFNGPKNPLENNIDGLDLEVAEDEGSKPIFVEPEFYTADLRHEISNAQLAKLLSAEEQEESLFTNHDFETENSENKNLSKEEFIRYIDRLRKGEKPEPIKLKAKLDLSGMDFSGLDLSHVNFNRANLSRAIFRNARLEVTDFIRCDLTAADFTNANLESAVLKKTIINGTNFRKAQLSYAIFTSAKGSKAVFDGASCRFPFFDKASIIDSSFQNVTMTYANLEDANFSNCVFRKSSLKGIQAHRAIFRGAVFADIKLISSILSHANFRYAKLERVDLEAASLDFANFKRASLHGSIFFETSLRGTLFDGTDFRSAVIFNNIIASPATFVEDNVIIDESTIFKTIEGDQREPENCKVRKSIIKSVKHLKECLGIFSTSKA